MDTEYCTLRVRTGKDELFVFDSRTRTISSKKGLRVNRFEANLAIKQNALRWNPGTGQVIDATIYVEEDVDTDAALPSSSLKTEDIESVKNTDGLGDDTILVNGQEVRKTTVDFKNKYTKKDYAENNMA